MACMQLALQGTTRSSGKSQQALLHIVMQAQSAFVTKYTALLNPKISDLIQKRHSYTENIDSETSGDIQNACLHCGGVLGHL